MTIKQQKKALSSENLNKSFVNMYQNKQTKKINRSAFINNCRACFLGFMRFSESWRIRRSDIVLSNAHVKVFIKKSKTDIYVERMWVYISTSRKICPVKQLKYWLFHRYTKTRRGLFFICFRKQDDQYFWNGFAS